MTIQDDQCIRVLVPAGVLGWGEAARVCNPIFFHFPVREGNELPSYAFPFSPAEIERGQVFEFHLNHVVHTTSPFELARTRWIDAAAAPEIAAIA
jgi:hypothetical protein